jgi:hypothetical protein
MLEAASGPASLGEGKKPLAYLGQSLCNLPFLSGTFLSAMNNKLQNKGIRNEIFPPILLLFPQLVSLEICGSTILPWFLKLD